jgi:Ca2+-binding EF-hand superfamily protein
MNKTDRAAKTETAFRLFDKNKDGFITREEFTKVSCTFAPFLLMKCMLILGF